MLESPEVSVVNLQPETSSGFEQRFQVDLRITNPNQRELEVDGLRFELDVNGQRLARGQTGDAVSVPRLGDALISVHATTTLLDVLRQVWAAQTAKGVRYRVEGRVFLKGLFPPHVDFEHEGELIAPPQPAAPAPKHGSSEGRRSGGAAAASVSPTPGTGSPPRYPRLARSRAPRPAPAACT